MDITPAPNDSSFVRIKANVNGDTGIRMPQAMIPNERKVILFTHTVYFTPQIIARLCINLSYTFGFRYGFQ